MRPEYEQVTTTSGGSFGVRADAPRRGWGFHWHVHPEAELTLIDQGRGRRFIGDHAGEFAAGDLCLIGPGLPHTWQSEPAGPGRSVVVQFLPALLGDTPETARARGLLRRAAVGLRFEGRPAAAAAERLRVMPGLPPLRRYTALLEVLDALAATRRATPLASPGFAGATTSGDRRRIDRVMQLIDRRLARPPHEPPTQAEAARLVSLSPSAFTRLFRRAAGRPYVAHLNLLRVGRACRLLAETDDPVTAVAQASGFNNLANFNRTFKRLKRTTPTAFRRRYA